MQNIKKSRFLEKVQTERKSLKNPEEFWDKSKFETFILKLI